MIELIIIGIVVIVLGAINLINESKLIHLLEESVDSHKCLKQSIDALTNAMKYNSQIIDERLPKRRRLKKNAECVCS